MICELRSRLAAAAVTLFALCNTAAFAQTVFTSNTTISDTDFSFEGQNIVVRGCTVTINGAHSFSSLTIERNAANQSGVVTHAAAFTNMSIEGMFLTITGDVVIQGADGALVASRIDVNARGHGTSAGPGASAAVGCCSFRTGGAGFGGAGGNGFNLVGGACYGSVVAPSRLGSGAGVCNGVAGGAGGGAVRLDIGGALRLHGSITADGASGGAGSNSSFSGGGSGGSIWITAASLSGDGSISARGGNGGGTLQAGGGGGGRIALIASSSTLSGTPSACGGNGFTVGGAGTIYSSIAGDRVVFITNCGVPGASTEFSGATTLDADVIVAQGAIVGPPVAQAGFHLTVSGDLSVDATSALAADRRGFGSALGPGVSTSFGCCSHRTGGAGHGGAGGSGFNHPGGECYDSVTQPTDLGSGAGTSSGVPGGVGGGAIRLTVLGQLTLDGRISADAGNGGAGANSSYTGGGSGGSIWVECDSLSGAGSFSAIGGAGGASAVYEGGGGGGGRLAVYFSSSSFTGSLTAHGGDGYVRGGAGTIFTKPAASRGTITIDNAGTLGDATEFTGEQTFDANLIIRGQGMLSHPHQHEGLHLTFTGDATIEPDGLVAADARGHPSATGPGTSTTFGCCSHRTGGAGYAGAGGSGSNHPGGECYGSVFQPTDLGSGAGISNGVPGGAGGGAIHLTFQGNLHHDGVFSANGSDGASGSNFSYTGGGSGGSLWVECAGLSGEGSFVANGGNGATEAGNPEAGGGGAGRISVYFDSSSFSGSYIAHGGDGFVRGGAGTIFTKPAASRGTITIDNHGTLGEATEFIGVQTLDANLIIRGQGMLSHPHQHEGLHLSFTGDATILSDGLIAADARGHPSATGPGASPSVGCCSYRTGGAAHAGAGGDGRNRLGGECYGSVIAPTQLGSGAGISNGVPGGAGGGALHLTFLGNLHNDGVLSSNGAAGSSGANFSYTGGGSGGSLWVECAALSGAGLFAANGGNGASEAGNPEAGGGGAGRIAVYFNDSSFSGNYQSHGGVGFVAGGAGTIFTKPASARGTITIDNNGTVGEATEFSGDVAFDANLHVLGQGFLSHPPTADPLHLSLTGDATIDPDGAIAADARGFPSGQGPGASQSQGCCNLHTGGAGHGGAGGSGDNRPGGLTYGDFQRPDQLGSSAGSSNAVPGGLGGGALRLFIDGDLIINGRISADGGNGATGVNGAVTGGGSGGSLWIKAASVAGTGDITASGGNAGNTALGGGGGGGRIAVYACPVDMAPEQIAAPGGLGFLAGADGSVFLGSSSITITQQPTPQTYYHDRDVVTLSVIATTTQDPPTLSYRWRRNSVDLVDGDLGGTVSGAATSTLRINGIRCEDGGIFDVVITDACGPYPSDPALVSVFARADFNLDGALNSQDFFDFLSAFFTTDPSADFNADSIVNSQDFFDFLTAFFTGCA